MSRAVLQPVLRSERLILRPFVPADAPLVAGLADDRDIALNTLNLRHPYGVADAEEWIAAHEGQLARREAVTYAITLASDHRLMGAMGLILDGGNLSAELGYWVGKVYWGRGYATEAGRRLLVWAFPSLGLHRIHASHFPRNPASGRVLRKLGMRHEGTLREHVLKWGEHLDLEMYGMLERELET